MMSAEPPEASGVGVVGAVGVVVGGGVKPVGVGVGVPGVCDGKTPVGFAPLPVAVPYPLHEASTSAARNVMIPIGRRSTRIGNGSRREGATFLLGSVWYDSVKRRVDP